MASPNKVTAKWHDGYGWVMTFRLTDGPYERIAVDKAEAERIAKRVLPGVPVEWIGRPR